MVAVVQTTLQRCRTAGLTNSSCVDTHKYLCMYFNIYTIYQKEAQVCTWFSSNKAGWLLGTNRFALWRAHLPCGRIHHKGHRLPRIAHTHLALRCFRDSQHLDETSHVFGQNNPGVDLLIIPLKAFGQRFLSFDCHIKACPSPPKSSACEHLPLFLVIKKNQPWMRLIRQGISSSNACSKGVTSTYSQFTAGTAGEGRTTVLPHKLTEKPAVLRLSLIHI